MPSLGWFPPGEGRGNPTTDPSVQQGIPAPRRVGIPSLLPGRRQPSPRGGDSGPASAGGAPGLGGCDVSGWMQREGKSWAQNKTCLGSGFQFDSHLLSCLFSPRHSDNRVTTSRKSLLKVKTLPPPRPQPTCGSLINLVPPLLALRAAQAWGGAGSQGDLK